MVEIGEVDGGVPGGIDRDQPRIGQGPKAECARQAGKHTETDGGAVFVGYGQVGERDPRGNHEVVLDDERDCAAFVGQYGQDLATDDRTVRFVTCMGWSNGGGYNSTASHGDESDSHPNSQGLVGSYNGCTCQYVVACVAATGS